MGGFAWVTLATNDSYSLGALVLAHSLKAAGTVHQLAVLVTPGVTNAMREKLSSVFNLVQEVNVLDSRDETNLRLLKRPELGITFTKLHCWRLTQYEKCVFLDADTLVMQLCDELFEREELSAAPDVGWPDCFNSGVFVYRPSLETYEKLIQFALEKGSFDGGDQGLLNLFFSDWAHKDISRHLPFIYNMCSTACYSYLPAFKQFGANAKIIHFIGAQKPWLQYFNTETRQVQPSGDSTHLQEVLQRWWDIFCSLIHPQLSPAMPYGQLQQGVSPSYFPPQYAPPPNPISSADDYECAYDPWDDYDQKVAQNTHFTSGFTHYIQQNQPIESLNTNASHVADQSTIHSQPQSHNYSNNSAQNISFYQPEPQPVYHHIPRVPTPPPTPPTPQPQHHDHQQQFHYDQPYFHHSQPPPQHNETQHHQPDLQTQHNQPATQSHYSEPQYHQTHHQEAPNERFQHNEHHQHSNPPVEQHYHHQNDHYNSHQNKTNSFPSGPERPRSPNRTDPIPILPKECEATTTVSNDMSLKSTIEDCSNQDSAGLAGAFAQLTLGVPRTAEQDAFENLLRKQAWEVGNIDYLGKDSFDNIWTKITETLQAAPEPLAAAPEPEPSAPAQSQSQSASQEKKVESVPTKEPTTDSIPTGISKIDSPQVAPVLETPKQQIETPQVGLEAPSTPKSQATVIPEPQVAEKEAETLPATAVSVESQQQTLPEVPPTVKDQAVVEPESCPAPEPKKEVLETQTVVSEEPQQKESSQEVAACPIIQKKETEPVPIEPISKAIVEPVCPLPQAKKDDKEATTTCPLPSAQKLPEVPTSEALKQEVPTTQPQEIATPKVEEIPQAALPVQEAPEAIPQVKEVPKPVPQSKDSQAQEALKPSVPIALATSQPIEASKKPEESTDKTVVSDKPSEISVASTTTQPAASATESKVAPKVAPVETSKQVSEPTVPSSPTPKDAPKAAGSKAASKDSPKTKVTEATPPATPSSPTVEKTKQALAAEAEIPETPPPTEGGSTPTPPPRKTDKPKKAAAKPKK